MTEGIVRPVRGRTYYAPVLSGQSVPVVPGEHHGVIVDGRSQSAAVVYTTRAAACAAMQDPAVWAPSNAARFSVAAVRYRGGPMMPFEWADGVLS